MDQNEMRGKFTSLGVRTFKSLTRLLRQVSSPFKRSRAEGRMNVLNPCCVQHPSCAVLCMYQPWVLTQTLQNSYSHYQDFTKDSREVQMEVTCQSHAAGGQWKQDTHQAPDCRYLNLADVLFPRSVLLEGNECGSTGAQIPVWFPDVWEHTVQLFFAYKNHAHASKAL